MEHSLLTNFLVIGCDMGRGVIKMDVIPTRSEEREVLGVGSIPDAILPSCQYMKNIAL